MADSPSQKKYKCQLCDFEMDEKPVNGKCPSCGRKAVKLGPELGTWTGNHPIENCGCAYCKDQSLRTISEKIIELADDKTTLKEIAPTIAAYLMHRFWIYTFSDNEEVVLYSAEKGIYERGGEVKLKGIAQEIINIADTRGNFGKKSAEEVVGHVQRSTYIERENFEPPLNFVCLQNGIYDTEKGEFLQHSPEMRFLTKLGINYKPGADCPKISEFLSQVLQPEDVPMLEELCGYLLLRDYRFQKAFMFNGEGSNGKSTLLNIIIKFLGEENVSHIALQDLTESRFAIVNLYCKYANVYADLSDRALKDSGRFKMLTGGDPIYAEQKFRAHFRFDNFAKLLFSCNRIPLSRDNSDAFFRRWVILDFKNQFLGKSEKRNLSAELTTEVELSGLLNLALLGLDRLLINNEFTNIESVDKMRETYIRKSDSIHAFAMDMLEPSIDGAIPKPELWTRYLKYCGDNRVLVAIEKAFWERIPQLFQVESAQLSISGKKGVRAFRGITWKRLDNDEHKDVVEKEEPQRKLDD